MILLASSSLGLRACPSCLRPEGRNRDIAAEEEEADPSERTVVLLGALSIVLDEHVLVGLFNPGLVIRYKQTNKQIHK